jgi:ethanolamine permease
MSLTAAMITMSVFGAVVMYIMSMLSLFKLRRSAPELARSFLAPGYPLVPGLALALAAVCLVAMVWFNPQIAGVFVALMALGMGLCWLSLRRGGPQPDHAVDAV